MARGRRERGTVQTASFQTALFVLSFFLVYACFLDLYQLNTLPDRNATDTKDLNRSSMFPLACGGHLGQRGLNFCPISVCPSDCHILTHHRLPKQYACLSGGWPLTLVSVYCSNVDVVRASAD